MKLDRVVRPAIAVIDRIGGYRQGPGPDMTGVSKASYAWLTTACWIRSWSNGFGTIERIVRGVEVGYEDALEVLQ
jgi:hypothetical protein